MTLLFLRAAINEDIKFAPFELVFGTLGVLPGAINPQEELCAGPQILTTAFKSINFPLPQLSKWHTHDNDNIMSFDFTKVTIALLRKGSHQPPLTASYF